MSEDNPIFAYWFSLQPEKCKKCECSYLDFTPKGDPIWECELEECYQEDPITLGMEDRGEDSDRGGRRRPSPEVTASSGDE